MRYSLLLLALLALSVRAEEPIAQTKLGALRGVRLDAPGVLVFKGVHYGQSTAGAARFKPPQPVVKWQGVADATRFGDTCPQGGDVGRRTKVEGEILPMSEDCLVLNIWTPALDGKARPVMVWFHGRGFYAGAGSERLYDGARLAKRGDLVVVTVNHRLNVFGHLYLGKVGGEEFATSGNAGTQDMQLALEWVRDNIAAFGGDGSNVTIFGESGGGAKVSTLLGVPSARGLFKRGIIQSGPRLNGTPLDDAIANTETVMTQARRSDCGRAAGAAGGESARGRHDGSPHDARLRPGDGRQISASRHVRAASCRFGARRADHRRLESRRVRAVRARGSQLRQAHGGGDSPGVGAAVRRCRRCAHRRISRSRAPRRVPGT